MQKINRVQPALAAGLMKTYSLRAPLETHFRKATCQEMECDAYVYGWRSIIDEQSGLGQMQAAYIRRTSKRKFTESRDALGMTIFEFEAGQTCFNEHMTHLERDPLYIVRGGDWRGNPRGDVRVHQRPDDWVDDFANHQIKIADKMNEG